MYQHNDIYLSLYEKALPESMSLGEKWSMAQQCGYDGIEISVDETDGRLARVLDLATKEAVLDEIRAKQIPIRTMCLSGQRRFPLGSRDESIRQKSIELLCRAIDFSREAGIRIIQIPGYDVWYEERGADTERLFEEGLRAVIPYAASNGVIVAFETMENDFMNTAEKAMAYVSRIRSPYLQIYPDLGNIRNGTDNPYDDLRMAHGHIVAAHLKETVAGVYRNMEYGNGRVDFVGCFKVLLAQGVGLFNCEFWYDNVTDPATYITRNRRYIENCLIQAKG